jgi:hypothetical protein
MSEKSGFLAGTEQERGSNPVVRSKFDKSHGKGLPAPHLKHPGEVAKESGSKYPGHTENGHKLPVERGTNFSGGITTHHHEPGKLGSMMAEGHRSIYGMPNKNHTDHVSPGKVVSTTASMHLHEPDPVHGGGDLHARQHNTGRGQERAKSSSPQHQDNHSSRSKAPHAKLDRVNMKGRS